jgi:hypothetical protein
LHQASPDRREWAFRLWSQPRPTVPAEVTMADEIVVI